MVRRMLSILPEAEAELLAAAQWYEERRAGLGVELIATADVALHEILEKPSASSIWRDGHPYR
jgi:hypothetical protein